MAISAIEREPDATTEFSALKARYPDLAPEHVTDVRQLIGGFLFAFTCKGKNLLVHVKGSTIKTTREVKRELTAA